MYLILVYDVAQERVGKVCRTLRRRLTWVQNSVFEGEVTDAELARIKKELAAIINDAEDSVLFYCINNSRGWQKETMGRERGNTDTFL